VNSKNDSDLLEPMLAGQRGDLLGNVMRSQSCRTLNQVLLKRDYRNGKPVSRRGVIAGLEHAAFRRRRESNLAEEMLGTAPVRGSVEVSGRYQRVDGDNSREETLKESDSRSVEGVASRVGRAHKIDFPGLDPRATL